MNKQGWHDGAVVGTVASQQEGSRFNHWVNWGLSVRNFNIFPVPADKGMWIRSIGYS